MRKILAVFLTAFILLLQCSAAFAADTIRWRNPKRINVYIPQHQRTLMMKHSLEEWTRKTNKKIIFYYVDYPSRADIEIQFVDKIGNVAGADRAIGVTQTKYAGRYFIKSTIQIAMRSPENRKLGDDAVYTVMLHEVGHAIGLLEHSPDKLSIMHPTEDDRQEIAKSDLERLKKLYGWQ